MLMESGRMAPESLVFRQNLIIFKAIFIPFGAFAPLPFKWCFRCQPSENCAPRRSFPPFLVFILSCRQLRPFLYHSVPLCVLSLFASFTSFPFAFSQFFFLRSFVMSVPPLIPSKLNVARNIASLSTANPLFLPSTALVWIPNTITRFLIVRLAKRNRTLFLRPFIPPYTCSNTSLDSDIRWKKVIYSRMECLSRGVTLPSTKNRDAETRCHRQRTEPKWHKRAATEHWLYFHEPKKKQHFRC